MTDYDDIINLPHHVSEKRKPMPRTARAAQFAPFDALKGFKDGINEKGSAEEERTVLSADPEEFF